jgi:F-type H+-transporting ATPase subunit a
MSMEAVTKFTGFGLEKIEAHAEAAYEAGPAIMHHIMDSKVIEIPFTYWVVTLPEIIINGWDFSITKHVIFMWVTGLVLLTIFGLAARQAKTTVPGKLRSVLEVLMLFIRDDVARKAIKLHPDYYLGYLLTTFFFILGLNLVGMIPGAATATGNIGVTAGLALVAFLMIQFAGIREHGLLGHTKNLAPHGLPVLILPVIVLIEFLGMLIKPFALCMRLFANMMSGHVVILAFISLVFIMRFMFQPAVAYSVAPFSVGLALFVHFLELLVAFIQAFIFTMLTATFIGLTESPSH